jgi:hypothetical protein
MLIALDIELSIYLVKYNLGSSCLIIDISVLCPGSYETKYMDEARNYGRDGYLQTLLHALIIWICSVACKTTSQLAFHSLYYTLYYGFKRYTWKSASFHLTIVLTCGSLTSKVICITLSLNMSANLCTCLEHFLFVCRHVLSWCLRLHAGYA